MFDITSSDLTEHIAKIQLPKPDSHKGQNGKLLIIGGSDLFHAASKWSLDVASKIVDMVFYSSVPSNNDLIQEAKQNFWNGIVVSRETVEEYLEEADCVLIGPGMERSPETANLTNDLLERYPHKKWVVDAGALQMAKPNFFQPNFIITPHNQELDMIVKNEGSNAKTTQELLGKINNPVMIQKGKVDLVFSKNKVFQIEGGNAGMTKGGTGDVLAGLVAGLFCTHDAETSAIVGSYVNKKAGEELAKNVGPFFNASDLAKQVPKTLWEIVKNNL